MSGERDAADVEMSRRGRRWLNKKQVASRIESSVSFVEKHLGEIPHFKLGRKLLFDQDEIDAWIERHRVNNDREQLKELVGTVVDRIVNSKQRKET